MAGMTPAWFRLRYHQQQTKAWRTNARFVALAAGRGSGKTELARRRVVRFLNVKKPWSDPLYFYALPTMQQAKRVAWDAILRLIPPHWIKGVPNKSSMKIETIYGSCLYVVGMDKPHRVEGVQWDGGVVDESCDQRPGAFDKTLLPAFSHRNAWCWRIGVPKRHGIGAVEFKEFFDKGMAGEDGIESYTWKSEEILTPDQMAFFRSHMDERDFNEQFGASWESSSGAIFYAFSESVNVTPLVHYDPELPIVVGSDFNVDPMAWVIGHIVDDELYVFDELFLRNTNTQETLNYLYARYGQHQTGWEFYGDASGRARKTSASASDYAQIKRDARFKHALTFYNRRNPAVADRFASCNAMLRSAAGRARLYVHPRCKNLITDLKGRAYKEGTSAPNDKGDVGHITDGLGYIVHSRFPSTIIIPTGSPGVYA